MYILIVKQKNTYAKPPSGRKTQSIDLDGGSITFPLFVEVDEIYNLACPASPIHYQFDPVQTTKTSVHGPINMLGLARA